MCFIWLSAMFARSNICTKGHLCKATFAQGKGSKLGEPCPKVRLSQDRLPIEPFAYFKQMSFAQMLLHANVTLRKCRFVQMSLCTNVTQPFIPRQFI
jgi:hypothetical protein